MLGAVAKLAGKASARERTSQGSNGVMRTYNVRIPSVSATVLHDRLCEMFDTPVEVEEVVSPRQRVSIRQASEEQIAALEAKNLEHQFAIRKRLLSKAEPLDRVRDLLGISSRQTLHNWVERGKIIALLDNGRVMLPLWQFDAASDDKILIGFTIVLKALRLKGFSAALWFTTPNPELGNKSPISLLKDGLVEKVAAVAEIADIVS